jgi:hypothetical protein
MDDQPVPEVFEDKHIRCPRLGHQISFHYCRREAGDQPCSRALTCWAPHFRVEDYFRRSMSGEEFERCFGVPPKDKMSTLLELVEQARKRMEDQSSH